LPEKSILRTDRGVILFEAGELVKAEASLAEALRTNSSDMYAVLYMGRLLYKNGDLEGARKLFLKLSYNQPEYSKVYFELGQIASDLKENGMSNFYLGKYYLFEGKFDLAMANFSLALSSKTLPEKIQEEGKELLEKAKKMKK
jgi:tetratricopeptide (TPR) repeat protein